MELLNNDLLLLLTEINPDIIWLQGTFLKKTDKINIKNFESYNYTHNTRLRSSGSVSILIRNYILQSKINLNINLQAIAAKATIHRTINICSLYIPLQDSINENDLNNFPSFLSY